jgi:hypothetical protein
MTAAETVSLDIRQPYHSGDPSDREALDRLRSIIGQRLLGDLLSSKQGMD